MRMNQKPIAGPMNGGSGRLASTATFTTATRATLVTTGQGYSRQGCSRERYSRQRAGLDGGGGGVATGSAGESVLTRSRPGRMVTVPVAGRGLALVRPHRPGHGQDEVDRLGVAGQHDLHPAGGDAAGRPYLRVHAPGRSRGDRLRARA